MWGSGVTVALPRWKRILDTACILVTSPVWIVVMVAVGVWVKLVSPGPIFYRQDRIGLRGRRFSILKFRSMQLNSETRSHELHLERLMQNGRPMVKLDSIGDPRLIMGGRIIRALALDELPQIFNVLQGEMSLVGPRPCTPEEFARYETAHKERVKVLPGLTGHWQVSGKNKTTFGEMIAMDIFYGNNMSLWRDLLIILKTVPALIGQILDARKSRPSSAVKPFAVQHERQTI
jgi:lipopolysaccharide/colanic/teichoic acid biosynthesis glycosyltransferase